MSAVAGKAGIITPFGRLRRQLILVIASFLLTYSNLAILMLSAEVYGLVPSTSSDLLLLIVMGVLLQLCYFAIIANAWRFIEMIYRVAAAGRHARRHAAKRLDELGRELKSISQNASIPPDLRLAMAALGDLLVHRRVLMSPSPNIDPGDMSGAHWQEYLLLSISMVFVVSFMVFVILFAML